MVAMNGRPRTTVRDDGYVQDEASQLVVEAVEARPGELVVDLCAAPGGKATGIAGGATGWPPWTEPGRTGGRQRRRRPTASITPAPTPTDQGARSWPGGGRRPTTPLPDGLADRVLVDAPCSGLGSLRRRPDARWRVEPEAPAAWPSSRSELVDEAARLLRPGGTPGLQRLHLRTDRGPSRWSTGAIGRHGLDDGCPSPAIPPGVEHDGMAVLVPDQTDGMMLARLRSGPAPELLRRRSGLSPASPGSGSVRRTNRPDRTLGTK